MKKNLNADSITSNEIIRDEKDRLINYITFAGTTQTGDISDIWDGDGSDTGAGLFQVLLRMVC